MTVTPCNFSIEYNAFEVILIFNKLEFLRLLKQIDFKSLSNFVVTASRKVLKIKLLFTLALKLSLGIFVPSSLLLEAFYFHSRKPICCCSKFCVLHRWNIPLETCMHLSQTLEKRFVNKFKPKPKINQFKAFSVLVVTHEPIFLLTY